MGHYCDSSQREKPFCYSTSNQIISRDIGKNVTTQWTQPASILDKLFNCSSTRHAEDDDDDPAAGDAQELISIFQNDKSAKKEIGWLFTREELLQPIDVKSQKFQGFRKHFKK